MCKVSLVGTFVIDVNLSMALAEKRPVTTTLVLERVDGIGATDVRCIRFPLCVLVDSMSTTTVVPVMNDLGYSEMTHDMYTELATPPLFYKWVIFRFSSGDATYLALKMHRLYHALRS